LAAARRQLEIAGPAECPAAASAVTARSGSGDAPQRLGEVRGVTGRDRALDDPHCGIQQRRLWAGGTTGRLPRGSPHGPCRVLRCLDGWAAAALAHSMTAAGLSVPDPGP